MNIELSKYQIKLKSGKPAGTILLGETYLVKSVNNELEEFICTSLSESDAVLTPASQGSTIKYTAKLNAELTEQEKASIITAIKKGYKNSDLGILNKALMLGFLSLDPKSGYKLA